MENLGMPTETLKVRLTLTEDILGTLPSNPDIYSTYIASKSDKKDEEVERMRSTKEIIDEELTSKEEEPPETLTVFVRDDDGQPCVYDYLIKGFFKNANKALRLSDFAKCKKLSAYKTKIDNLLFITPRLIKLETDQPVTYCERPLRASTAQGERIALSASESLPAGTTLEFTIHSLNKEMMTYVREYLDYGQLNGLGQWHNSGKGRFTWEEI